MKYLVIGFTLALSAAGFVACSGTVEDADDGEKRSSADVCTDVCREISTCYGDSGSGLSTEDILEDCRQDCQASAADARRAGCEAPYQAAMECVGEQVGCSVLYGSGESPCESEITRYYRCMSNSSGSGPYYSDEGS